VREAVGADEHEALIAGVPGALVSVDRGKIDAVVLQALEVGDYVPQRGARPAFARRVEVEAIEVRASDQDIFADASDEDVLACAAVNRVLAAPTVQSVRTPSARKAVGEHAAEKAFRGVSSNNRLGVDVSDVDC